MRGWKLSEITRARDCCRLDEHALRTTTTRCGKIVKVFKVGCSLHFEQDVRKVGHTLVIDERSL